MDSNHLAKLLGDACYGFLTINFFWGLYHIILGFRRVKQLSFASQDEQAEFMDVAWGMVLGRLRDGIGDALRGGATRRAPRPKRAG